MEGVLIYGVHTNFPYTEFSYLFGCVPGWLKSGEIAMVNASTEESKYFQRRMQVLLDVEAGREEFTTCLQLEVSLVHVLVGMDLHSNSDME